VKGQGSEPIEFGKQKGGKELQGLARRREKRLPRKTGEIPHWKRETNVFWGLSNRKERKRGVQGVTGEIENKKKKRRRKRVTPWKKKDLVSS